MRKNVIAFPIDRAAKAARCAAAPQLTPVPRPTLVGSWRRDPRTDRLEQHWTTIEPATESARRTAEAGR
jgi:hypothetical protein